MDNKKIAAASIMITFFTILSKALGVFRVMVINWKFGQGIETDAYNAAVRVTSVVMAIIASAIFTALVPIMASVKQRYGVRGKFKFFNNITNIVMSITIVMALIVYIFAPVFIRVMYVGFTGEKFDLTVRMLRMAVPIVLSLALMNLASAYINSFNIYGPYAMMGLPYNLIFFIYLFFMPLSIKGLMVATILANFSQFLIQAPSIFKTGYRFKPLIDTKDPFVLKTLYLVIPIAIGQAVQQINIIVDQTLASGFQDGIITAMDTAGKVNDSIIAIFITGLTTVMFPVLSEAFEKDNKARILSLLDDGFGLICLITIPCTVGLIALSGDLIKMLFERGAFTGENTVMTSDFLIFYSLGLTGMGLRMLFSKVYFSLHDTKTPMINGSIAVVINIILNLILIKIIAHKGLALATSISTTVSTILLMLGLTKKLDGLKLSGYLIEFSKILLAAVAMGIYCVFVNRLLSGFLPNMVRLVASVATSMLVYFLLVLILRVKAVGFFMDIIKRKIKRA